jgi:WD40 repeat protein
MVAASRNHHGISVFGEAGDLCRTCLGHGGGVTALGPIGESTFLSGSTDLTARIWDIRMDAPAAQLPRHAGPVSAVAALRADGTFVVTGGTDHVVRGWDARMQRPLFEAVVGLGVPTAIGPGEEGEVLVITRAKDATGAEGYQCQIRDDADLLEPSPSLMVKITREPPGMGDR